MHVALRQMQYWDANSQQWLLATGSRTVYVGDADALKAPVGDPGASSALPLRTTIHVLGTGTGHQTVRYDVRDAFSSSHDGGSLSGTGLSCDDEQLSATLVSGNLVVPRGQWCDIIDATVKGNLVIDQSAGVRIEDSSIGGSVIALDNKVAADPLSANTDVLCNTTVGHDVEIIDSGRSVPWNVGLCGGNTVHGTVAFIGNAATGTITGNTVSGAMTCGGDGSVAASDNTVGGVADAQCTTVHVPSSGNPHGGKPARGRGPAKAGGDRRDWNRH
jgi:hypothetical protein